MRELSPFKAFSIGLILLCLFIADVFLNFVQTTTVLAQDILYETIATSPVITAEWSPDGSLLAVGTTTGVTIYDQQLQEIGTVPNVAERVVSLSWNPTSTQLAGVVYPHDKLADPVVPPTMVSSLLVWQRNPDNSFTLQHQMDYPGANNIISAAWSLNGQMIAAAEEEQIEGTGTFIGRITVWNTTDWSKISETLNTYDYIARPVWSPDSSTIASSGVGLCIKLTCCRSDEAKYLYVYFFSDPLTGERISFQDIAATVVHMDWSPENVLALSYGDLEVKDMNTGQRLVDGMLAFSANWIPNTNNLLVWVYPDQIRIYNPSTNEIITTDTITDVKYVTAAPNGYATIITNDDHITIRTLGESSATPTFTPSVPTHPNM